MKKNVVKEKSFQFAINIINLYKFLVSEKKEYVMSKQLLRSGTSIGANIAEADVAQSKKDFIYKLSISLKEASETLYWLDLLEITNYITKEQWLDVKTKCDELQRILTSIIKTTKEGLEQNKTQSKIMN